MDPVDDVYFEFMCGTQKQHVINFNANKDISYPYIVA